MVSLYRTNNREEKVILYNHYIRQNIVQSILDSKLWKIFITYDVIYKNVATLHNDPKRIIWRETG